MVGFKRFLSVKPHNPRRYAGAVVLAALVVGVMLAAAGCGGDDDTDTLTYGGQNYRTVIIGGKTWMAENLNYQTANSWCYNNNSSICATYGRLYTWYAAKSACNGVGNGWRLPTDDDWDDLTRAVGGLRLYDGEFFYWSGVGTKLKSKIGWNGGGNGTDDFGFSALPGGWRYNGNFDYIGFAGMWWSATESDFAGGWWSATEFDNEYAGYRDMWYNYDHVEDEWIAEKNNAFSARCVRG